MGRMHKRIALTGMSLAMVLLGAAKSGQAQWPSGPRDGRYDRGGYRDAGYGRGYGYDRGPGRDYGYGRGVVPAVRLARRNPYDDLPGVAIEPRLQPPIVEVLPAPLPPRGGHCDVVSTRKLARALVAESDAFLACFGPTACRVPQGDAILDDVERLRAASYALSADLDAGAPDCRIADDYRATAAALACLARRVDFVSQGRDGPNIDRVRRMTALGLALGDQLAVAAARPVRGVSF